MTKDKAFLIFRVFISLPHFTCYNLIYLEAKATLANSIFPNESQFSAYNLYLFTRVIPWP